MNDFCSFSCLPLRSLRRKGVSVKLLAEQMVRRTGGPRTLAIGLSRYVTRRGRDNTHSHLPRPNASLDLSKADLRFQACGATAVLTGSADATSAVETRPSAVRTARFHERRDIRLSQIGERYGLGRSSNGYREKRRDLGKSGKGKNEERSIRRAVRQKSCPCRRPARRIDRCWTEPRGQSSQLSSFGTFNRQQPFFHTAILRAR